MRFDYYRLFDKVTKPRRFIYFLSIVGAVLMLRGEEMGESLAELMPSRLEVRLTVATPGAGLSVEVRFQILEAYSAIVRSVENFPEHAAAWMLMLSHLARSA